MNCSDDPVPNEVVEQNLKLSKEHRLAYFMCLRLTTPSIRLHPNVATTGWPNWFSMILLHVDQIAFEKCLHEFDLFELCLMSAWNVGDLPLLIGNEMLFGELKMESIGIALVEIWAVLNPIQFEVWVELESHKRSRSRWNSFGQDQVNVVSPSGLKREGLTLPLKIFDPEIWLTRRASIIARQICSKLKRFQASTIVTKKDAAHD